MTEARWPALMDLGTACKYLTFKRHEFRALITAGVIPPATEPLPGKKLWGRDDLDRASQRMREIEVNHAKEEAKLVARRAIEAFRPPPLRHGNQAQR